MDQKPGVWISISDDMQQIARQFVYWARALVALQRLCEDPAAKQRLLRAVRAATGEPEPDPPQSHTNAKQKRWLFGGRQ
ncbi:MAG TPA: hypothetical protein VGH74_07695 [Planctomycetaceae bacterium]|jgi:hypothetical protein